MPTANSPFHGFHLLQLKHALALEMKGLKHSQGSVYAYVKRHLGFRGNRQRVYQQLLEHIDKQPELGPSFGTKPESQEGK